MYNASVPSSLSIEVQGCLLFTVFIACCGILFLLIGVLFFNYDVTKLFKRKKNKKEVVDSSSSSSGEEGVDKLREQIRKDKTLQKEFMEEL
jgi:hypothetical protein